jgi:hypothetical protein
MESSRKRPRISIDVQPELWRRLRLAAARCDLTIQQYLREAIEARLREDLGDDLEPAHMVLTASSDPVLAELWDNPRDAEYDRL